MVGRRLQIVIVVLGCWVGGWAQWFGVGLGWTGLVAGFCWVLMFHGFVGL